MEKQYRVKDDQMSLSQPITFYSVIFSNRYMGLDDLWTVIIKKGCLFSTGQFTLSQSVNIVLFAVFGR